jgi:hypothetical protein
MIDNETPPTPEQAPEPREPSQAEVAAMIADQLGEMEETVRKSILTIVRAAGRTHAKELLSLTRQTEENGGIMVPDNSRRRTPGGVFFYLAYTRGRAKSGRPLEKPDKRARKRRQANAQEVEANDTPKARSAIVEPREPQPAMVCSWDDRRAIVKEAEAEKGTANVKISLVGRPGKVVDRGQFIVTVMESSKVPMLPKGLPTPTTMTTKYAVYVAAKQWKKVAEAIQDPEDALIIEGFPKTDAETSAIAVFTTNITTKKQQMAKKQPQSKAE